MLAFYCRWATERKMQIAGTYGNNRRGMSMNNALDIGAGRMDGSMQFETFTVHAKVGGSAFDGVRLHVHFDKAAGSHFVVQHSPRVHEELLLVLVQSGLQTQQYVDELLQRS